MYLRNLDHATTDFEYLGMRKTGRYWFPHWVKYVAWTLLVICVGVSTFILIYYGMSFGMMKSYLWLTGIIMTFAMGLVLFTPARICIFVFLDSILLKLKPILVRRKVYSSLLSNPDNPERRKRIEDFRRYNAHLYNPPHYRHLQPRLDDIKYHIEMRNLTVEIAAHFIFLFLLIYVVLFSVTSYGFNITNVIDNMVVKANYTRTLPLHRATTYKTFVEYLNLSLLPALLQNFDVIYGGMNGTNSSDIFQRGWTMDPAVKLIGVPRLRQARATSALCFEHPAMPYRNPACAEELQFFNHEDGDFTVDWQPGTVVGLTPNQEKPWKYQSAWDSVSVRTVGKYSYYPGGGYILNLARNLEDSRLIIEFMHELEWIDIKTRAVFIEFTTYCVNINVFTVVTLIAEKSGSGYFITSSLIQPCKFTFNVGELEMIYIIMTICFALLLFIFLCREGLRIRRTSLKHYIRKPFAILDLLVALLGAIIIIFIVLQSYYVKTLIRQFESANNNQFVSFAFAAYWSKIGIALEAIVIVLAGFKLFHLLTYRVLFYQLQTALGHSWKNFINLVLKTFVIIVAFTMFFYLVLHTTSSHFSNWPLTLSTMTGLTVALDSDFDYKIFSEAEWQVSLMYYVVFVITIPLLIMNLYIVIICLYFHEVKKVSLINKYSITKYVKYLLTRSEKSDIFVLAYDKHFKANEKKKINQRYFEHSQEELPMRLRGGGNKKSKQSLYNEHIDTKEPEVYRDREEKLREDYKLEKENRQIQKEFDDLMKETIHTQDFVKKKTYDVTGYIALPLERILAMKYLTIALLTDDKEEKRKSREIAIKAYYLYAGFPSTIYDREKFFIVIVGPEELPLKEYVFTPMKSKTEEIGLLKKWVIDDVVDDIEFSNLKKELRELDGNLCQIIQNMHSRKLLCKRRKKPSNQCICPE